MNFILKVPVADSGTAVVVNTLDGTCGGKAGVVKSINAITYSPVNI